MTALGFFPWILGLLLVLILQPIIIAYIVLYVFNQPIVTFCAANSTLHTSPG